MPIETHLKAINDLALKNFNQSSSVAKVPYEKIWEVLVSIILLGNRPCIFFMYDSH